jgi:hypothetical protein
MVVTRISKREVRERSCLKMWSEGDDLLAARDIKYFQDVL